MMPHRHWLVHLQRNQRPSVFGKRLNRHCYIKPLLSYGNDTIKDALKKYIHYIIGKGPDFEQIGKPLWNTKFDKATNKRTHAEQISELVRAGHRLSDILVRYPSVQDTRVAMVQMKYRPQRTWRTDVLHLFGPSGIGKTTYMMKIMEAIRNCYPEIDHYFKMGGLDKRWEGYDNQPIVWIDDPVKPTANGGEAAIQSLKNVLSTGACYVEFKGGSFVFDAHIIILTSNLSASEIASACGYDNQEATYFL